jgi:hypothetical protein
MFFMHDSAQVNVELVSGWLRITQPGEVEMYAEAFTRLAEMAVYGKRGAGADHRGHRRPRLKLVCKSVHVRFRNRPGGHTVESPEAPHAWRQADADGQRGPPERCRPLRAGRGGGFRADH